MTKDEIIKDLFDLVKVSFEEYSINSVMVLLQNGRILKVLKI